MYSSSCQDRVAGLLFCPRRNPSLLGRSSVTVLAIVRERFTTEDLCFMPKHELVQPDQPYGRLTTVRLAERTANGKYLWLCNCKCGNTSTVDAYSLLSGHTISCGCLHRETLALGGTARLTHGESRGRKTAEFRAWTAMKTRCYNSNDKRYDCYGGRGIKVCDEWLGSYEAFLAHVGRRPSNAHSLDRFPDTNGNYEPGNVRWATQKEQQRNRTNNFSVPIGGVERCASEWAEISGLSPNTITRRFRAGHREMEILQPKRKNQHG